MNEYDAIWKLMGNENFLDFLPTGSREICDPAPTDTDYDIVALIDGKNSGWNFIHQVGFTLNSINEEEYELGENFFFQCFRLGEINLIVTDDPDFFRRWKIATKIAKEQNITDKDERIELFDTVFYSSEYNA